MVERAVPHSYLVVRGTRRVPALREDIRERFVLVTALGGGARALDPRLALQHCACDSRVVRFDRCREQPGEQRVVARRQLDGDLGAGDAVELRGTAGAGTAPTAAPRVRDGEQPVGREPVQVVCGERPADAGVRGGFVLATGSGWAATNR